MEISDYLKEKFKTALPKALKKRYGFGKYYTWQQVRKTVADLFPDLSSRVCYAYPLYCEKAVFEELAEEQEFENEYDETRKAFDVPVDNMKPFFGKRSDFSWHTQDTPNSDATAGAHLIGGGD